MRALLFCVLCLLPFSAAAQDAQYRPLFDPRPTYTSTQGETHEPQYNTRQFKTAWHNGSIMEYQVDANYYVQISYDRPRPDMAQLVGPGTVLFRGNFDERTASVVGYAYVFKWGCAPFPYAVRGGFSNVSARRSVLTLVGFAPTWTPQGCAVSGMTLDNRNAKLEFFLSDLESE